MTNKYTCPGCNEQVRDPHVCRADGVQPSPEDEAKRLIWWQEGRDFERQAVIDYLKTMRQDCPVSVAINRLNNGEHTKS